jgi:hypothetical protein
MRFTEYLNESFEDKLFSILDDFLKPGAKIDIDELCQYLSQAFDVSIKLNRKKQRGISGGNSVQGIRIDIPTNWSGDTNTLKGEIIGALFHELAHQKQRESNPDMLTMYIRGTDDNTGFLNYFVQAIERPSQALTSATSFLVNNVDPFEIMAKIDDILVEKKPMKDRINDINTILSTNDGKLKGFITIYGFIKLLSTSESLNDPEHGENELRLRKQFIIQFKLFMKNFKNSYKKLKYYFKKYGII